MQLLLAIKGTEHEDKYLRPVAFFHYDGTKYQDSIFEGCYYMILHLSLS